MQEIIGKEVVIVAGPSASGKSYLIRQLMTKRKSQLKDQIYNE
jgi:ABC-type polar amino acid transport system ATPase subunit